MGNESSQQAVSDQQESGVLLQRNRSVRSTCGTTEVDDYQPPPSVSKDNNPDQKTSSVARDVAPLDDTQLPVTKNPTSENGTGRRGSLPVLSLVSNFLSSSLMPSSAPEEIPISPNQLRTDRFNSEVMTEFALVLSSDSSDDSGPQSPVTPPPPNLDHLTDAEKAQIAEVLIRAKDIEREEDARLRQLETDLSSIEETSSTRCSSQDVIGLALECPLCCKNEIDPERPEYKCVDCSRRVCCECGTFNNESGATFAEWVCVICMKRRHFIQSSGMWFHGLRHAKAISVQDLMKTSSKRKLERTASYSYYEELRDTPSTRKRPTMSKMSSLPCSTSPEELVRKRQFIDAPSGNQSANITKSSSTSSVQIKPDYKDVKIMHLQSSQSKTILPPQLSSTHQSSSYNPYPQPIEHCRRPRDFFSSQANSYIGHEEIQDVHIDDNFIEDEDDDEYFVYRDFSEPDNQSQHRRELQPQPSIRERNHPPHLLIHDDDQFSLSPPISPRLQHYTGSSSPPSPRTKLSGTGGIAECYGFSPPVSPRHEAQFIPEILAEESELQKATFATDPMQAAENVIYKMPTTSKGDDIILMKRGFERAMASSVGDNSIEFMEDYDANWTIDVASYAAAIASDTDSLINQAMQPVASSHHPQTSSRHHHHHHHRSQHDYYTNEQPYHYYQEMPEVGSPCGSSSSSACSDIECIMEQLQASRHHHHHQLHAKSLARPIASDKDIIPPEQDFNEESLHGTIVGMGANDWSPTTDLSPIEDVSPSMEEAARFESITNKESQKLLRNQILLANRVNTRLANLRSTSDSEVDYEYSGSFIKRCKNYDNISSLSEADHARRKSTPASRNVEAIRRNVTEAVKKHETLDEKREFLAIAKPTKTANDNETNHQRNICSGEQTGTEISEERNALSGDSISPSSSISASPSSSFSLSPALSHRKLTEEGFQNEVQTSKNVLNSKIDHFQSIARNPSSDQWETLQSYEGANEDRRSQERFSDKSANLWTQEPPNKEVELRQQNSLSDTNIVHSPHLEQIKQDFSMEKDSRPLPLSRQTSADIINSDEKRPSFSTKSSRSREHDDRSYSQESPPSTPDSQNANRRRLPPVPAEELARQDRGLPNRQELCFVKARLMEKQQSKIDQNETTPNKSQLFTEAASFSTTSTSPRNRKKLPDLPDTELAASTAAITMTYQPYSNRSPLPLNYFKKPALVNIKGLLVPRDVEEKKSVVLRELVLVTHARRRHDNEFEEIKDLERRIEEMRQLERKQMTQIQEKLADIMSTRKVGSEPLENTRPRYIDVLSPNTIRRRFGFNAINQNKARTAMTPYSSNSQNLSDQQQQIWPKNQAEKVSRIVRFEEKSLSVVCPGSLSVPVTIQNLNTFGPLILPQIQHNSSQFLMSRSSEHISHRDSIFNSLEGSHSDDILTSASYSHCASEKDINLNRKKQRIIELKHEIEMRKRQISDTLRQQDESRRFHPSCASASLYMAPLQRQPQVPAIPHVSSLAIYPHSHNVYEYSSAPSSTSPARRPSNFHIREPNSLPATPIFNPNNTTSETYTSGDYHIYRDRGLSGNMNALPKGHTQQPFYSAINRCHDTIPAEPQRYPGHPLVHSIVPHGCSMSDPLLHCCKPERVYTGNQNITSDNIPITNDNFRLTIARNVYSNSPRT